MAADRGPQQDVMGPKSFYRRWWFIALAVLVVLGGIGSLFGEEDPAEGSGVAAPVVETPTVTDTKMPVK